MPTSTSLLDSLPIELCDAIISLITSTKDLLNLALTCRQLCQFIIPDHIEYRQITCSTSDKFVWEHLLNRTDLAKRVHSVEVWDSVEYSTVAGVHRLIPRKFQMQSIHAEDSELARGLQLKAFAKSISVMKNLYSFNYSGPCPASLLFVYLAHFSPGLRAFEYEYNGSGPNRTPPWRDLIDTEIHDNKCFKNLEYLSSVIYCQSMYKYHLSTTVVSILHNAPFLETLVFFLSGATPGFPSPVTFLTGANWPKIKTLSIGGNVSLFKEDTDLQLRTSLMQSFFSRHASLEKFRLWCLREILIYPGTIQPDMLPKLDTLVLHFDETYPVSELFPENVIARLTNLSVNLCNVPDSFITSGHFRNLRRLVTQITSNRMSSLLEAIPNIERLEILLESPTDWYVPGTKCGVLHFLPDFIKHGKSLTHLSLFLRFPAEETAPEEYARELRRLEVIRFLCISSMFNLWYRIIRSPSGTVTLESHREDSDEWDAHLWMGFPRS